LITSQVSREFEFLGRHLKSLCVYGGVPYDSQLKAIREGSTYSRCLYQHEAQPLTLYHK
jgi:superfamily II DNA/RNA helicase